LPHAPINPRAVSDDGEREALCIKW
jgi:hypothetical protein